VRERFGDADGLRAIAILAVVLYETFRATAPQPLLIHPFLARLAADASQGLTLFFVLSGFTLAYPALAVMRQDGRSYLDVGRYAIKRLLRIYPAYLALLGLTLVLPTLATRYGVGGLATPVGPLSLETFVRNALFAGDGLGNDGFRSLAVVARWYLLFPLLLLLWVRGPWIFAALAALATVLDATTVAHGWSIGALLPLMLGIVAADIRSQHHRFERFALLLALGGAAAALVLEPFLRLLPGPQLAPEALRIDPVWAISLFGLVAGAGAFRIVERILSITVLRLVGAASFAISLVVGPVAAFVARHSSSAFGPVASAANAAALAVLFGYVFWQVLDRWFADGPLRRDVAEVIGPWIDRLLALIRADRVVLGPPPAPSEPDVPDERLAEGFYAPPPRALPADLAVVSKKSGTAEELAAEILETKKRLSERSTMIFTDPSHDPNYEKPGFYPRSTNGAKNGAKNGVTARTNTDFSPIDFSRLPVAPLPEPADLEAILEHEPVEESAVEPPAAFQKPVFEPLPEPPPRVAQIAEPAAPIPTPEPVVPEPLAVFETETKPLAPEPQAVFEPETKPEPAFEPETVARTAPTLAHIASAASVSPVTPVAPSAPVTPTAPLPSVTLAPIVPAPRPRPPVVSKPATPRQPIRLRIGPPPGRPPTS
jgi:peptidoglycan/LPS O-acetylase OafA/YrhL